MDAAANKKTVDEKGIPSQPLSAKDYVVIATVMFGFGIVLLLLFVAFTPRLLQADILNQFFYIVLIVWGLVSASVLFGVMRSYARLTHKYVRGAIELGGPAAFAALVVLGGFLVIPRTDTFDLTIRPHGSDAPLITSGQIRVEFGNFAPAQDINANGEADFKGVPHKFRGTTVRVLPKVDGYKDEYQTVVLDKDAIDLNLVKTPPPETVLKGKIVPAPGKEQRVKVLIQGEHGDTVPDRYGRFQFVIHKKLGEIVRVTVCASGKRIYDDYQTTGQDEIEIHTRKPDVLCGN